MSIQFHGLVVPDDALTGNQARQQRNVSAQGTLSDGSGSVEAVSLDPGEKRIGGSYRGRYADLMATEIEELFAAPGIEALPLAGGSQDGALDGYYTTRDIDRPTTPQAVGGEAFEGAVKKVGTRDSHRRGVATRSATTENDFGSDATTEIALPDDATNVRWFDPVGGSLEDATVQRSALGELATFDIYDVSEPTFYSFGDADPHYPTLTYDVPLDKESPADVRVWDDYNRERTDSGSTVGSTSVGDSLELDNPNAWQHVYSPAHQFVGRPVVDTGCLRLVFDLDEPALYAYLPSGGYENYDQVALGASSWSLSDADIQHIGLASAEVRAVFSDGSSSYTVDLLLDRGFDEVPVARGPNESSAVPSGLQTRLDPIAASNSRDAAPRKDVVARSDLR